jgi:glucosyl-dolichyl phosphate glucuronosyltransferase
VPSAMVTHRAGDERVTDDFVRRQALGIGQSERLRLMNAGLGARASKAASEVVKAVGTLVLAAAYAGRGQGAQARMLVKFRRWVWQGLMSR